MASTPSREENGMARETLITCDRCGGAVDLFKHRVLPALRDGTGAISTEAGNRNYDLCGACVLELGQWLAEHVALIDRTSRDPDAYVEGQGLDN